MTVSDIRQHFIQALANEDFTIDRTGAKTIEILGASFLADEPAIFGTPNQKYIDAEIEWYLSGSTNVNTLADIYGSIPKAWSYTANKVGEVNSNYGSLIFSKKHHEQFRQVVEELLRNPNSRRAQLIYNRPSIWVEFDHQGKNDFICTNAQTFYIRDNKLHMVSQMRSNDAWAGYRNDAAWAEHVQLRLCRVLNSMKSDHEPQLELGDIHWQVMNLHLYSHSFYLADAWGKGIESITKKEYVEQFPDSSYC